LPIALDAALAGARVAAAEVFAAAFSRRLVSEVPADALAAGWTAAAAMAGDVLAASTGDGASGAGIRVIRGMLALDLALVAPSGPSRRAEAVKVFVATNRSPVEG
jgi:hypothetical protein